MIKQNYFTAMDIQIWKARVPLPGAKPSSQYQTFQLMENAKVIGILMLDASKTMPGYDTKASALLDSMLAAIGLQRKDIKRNSSETCFLIMGVELAKRLWMDFEGPVKDYKDCSVAATYHPIDLLQQPSYKRQAWSDLQIIAKTWLNKSFR